MSFRSHTKWSARLMMRALGPILLLTGISLGGPVFAQLPAVQHYGSVEYVTGGFGIDESTALKNAMSSYPLAMTFASGDGRSTAAYASQVQVVVRDENDATILNVESQGPFLLARIPPGSYHVFATYNNQTQSRSVTLSESKTTRLVFEWPREAPSGVDGSTSADSDQGSGTGSSGAGKDPGPAKDPSATDTSSQSTEFAPGSIPGLD